MVQERGQTVYRPPQWRPARGEVKAVYPPGTVRYAYYSKSAESGTMKELL